MKQGLSKREKILLLSVGLVALVYLAIQFAILPLITRYTDDLRERDSLVIEERMVRNDINNINNIRATNADAIEQFELIKKEYPLLVPNEEIDPVLTNLSITNGLRPSRLQFTGSESAPQGAQEPLFTIVTVSMNVTGSYRSLLSLLDEVDKMQYIRITNLGYATNRQSDAPDDSSITLTFELTYVNP